MSVKFYPEKPISLLEQYIVKEDGTSLLGEIDVYRKLHTELTESEDEWHIWHDLKLPKHSDVFNYYQKTSAQIDFLILSKDGVMVLEVKGGYISLFENTFYYGRNLQNKMKQDPFRQAEGYKYTLKDNVLNHLGKCFFCHAVIFPHVDYSFQSKIFDENILWTKYRSPNYNGSILKFIRSVFEYTKSLHKKYFRVYPNLGLKEINSIRAILSPTIQDYNRYNYHSTLEWLQINNLEILEGLYKNKRIMIEGPPGSGKTTIAKAFIDQQIGKKGLYLCWNNLLMHYTKKIIHDRENLDNIEITTLLRYTAIIDPTLDIQAIIHKSESEFYDLLSSILHTLEASAKLPVYDYIIVDEGQDMFDRGIDLIINKICGYNKHGLDNGTALILYDTDQGYPGHGRNVLEIADLLSEYFAHFKLNEVKRSAQNPDIRKLSTNILIEPRIILSSSFPEQYPTISIRLHKNLESVKKYVVHSFLNQIRNERSSLRGGQCILLIESTLLKDTFKNEPGMHFWLTIKDIEEVTEQNVYDLGNKLRYTSILKYKGLEKENVFLIVTEPSEKNKYELYVGITRAINNVEILVVE